MIEVGLVGFGLAGRAFHAPVIRAVPGLHLAAIVQRSGTEAAEKYPDVRIVRSLDELLSIPEIRLIVIATPNDTHFAFARQCLEAGRDVVVDKPFTTTLAEAATLVQLAKDTGRLLTVYQNRRYDGDFQAIRKLIADGTLGRIVRFEREKAVADVAFYITLHHSNGMRAVLRSSILAATPRPRFVLFGTRGSFVKQAFDPQENNLRRGIVPVDTPWGAEPEENWGVLTVPAGDSFEHRRIPSAACDYRDYYSNVRDALLGRAA